MQIAFNRQDFRGLFLLPREMQRKGLFLWQLAEVAWRRPHAMEVLEHLRCLSQAVVHVFVVVARPQKVAVASHVVYEPGFAELDPVDPWQAIVDGSRDWAREFVASFEFAEQESWWGYSPLFDFWAYSETDYRRLQLRQ